MTAILIDIGRYVVRFGVMNSDNVLQQQFAEPTPSDPDESFDAYVLRVLREHSVTPEADSEFMIGAPGPFRHTAFRPMLMGGNRWDIDLTDLREKLSPQTYVVHDVIAGVLSVGALRPDDCIRVEGDPIDESDPHPHAMPYRSTLYIQTGVGLGAAALIPDANGERLPFSTEAGSSTIAPVPAPIMGQLSADDEDEQFVYEALRTTKNQWGYHTAQFLLSAPTLTEIHTILAPSNDPTAPADIVARAHAEDHLATRALGVFASFLGTFAGDLALTMRAYEGVYIGGPIVSALTAPARRRLKQRFSDRGTQNKQLTGVPLTLVKNEFNALLGLRESLRSLRRSMQQ